MTCEEFLELCETLRRQGFTDKDLLGWITKMFEDGKIGLDDLKKLAGALGYELSDEFIKRVSKK